MSPDSRIQPLSPEADRPQPTDRKELTDADLREIVEVFAILNGWYKEREWREAVEAVAPRP